MCERFTYIKYGWKSILLSPVYKLIINRCTFEWLPSSLSRAELWNGRNESMASPWTAATVHQHTDNLSQWNTYLTFAKTKIEWEQQTADDCMLNNSWKPFGMHSLFLEAMTLKQTNKKEMTHTVFVIYKVPLLELQDHCLENGKATGWLTTFDKMSLRRANGQSWLRC